MSTYRFIEHQRGHHSVRELCRVLGATPSAYYAWRHPARARHTRRYGTRRLWAELQAVGYQVGRYRIRRALRPHEPRAQQPR